jgi:aminocarboxymuconate-semialdehyde decarboxylase
MTSLHRIDVHQHVVPPFWAQQLAIHGGDSSGTVIPQWSPESAIAFMDANQIQAGVLSLTAPNVAGWKGAERRDVARRVNEYQADLVARWPDRFGIFATLPVPDIEGALTELGHALDTLRADGIILLSNYAGQYLGEPIFEPLWAELDRRHALVFVHPGMPAIEKAQGVAAPIVDYPFDTTRAAVQLVLNGVVDRYPGARIILAHAGGFLPYASHRFAELARVFRPDAASPADIPASFKHFYFDTALSSGTAALRSLKAFARSSRILFGSDFRYVPVHIAAHFTANLDAYDDLTSDEHSAIAHGNATTLHSARAARHVDCSSSDAGGLPRQ